MNESLLTVWNETLRRDPEAVALIDAATGAKWSRRALDEAAAAWQVVHGRDLARCTVVLAEANGLGWLTVFLGLLRSDAVIVALDPGEPVVAQQATARAIKAHWRWTGSALEAVATGGRRARDERRLLKLTSGSTGTPRALPFTDAQLIADARQVCASMGIAPADLNLGLIPFGHSYGLGNLVLPLFVQGTAVIAGVTALPHAMAEAVARWRPTVFPAVPALLRALSLAEVPAEAVASLRTVISAGAPLAPEVAKAFHAKFARAIHSFYGSSETGGITFDRTGEAALTGRSVGTPLEGVALHWERGGRFRVTSAAVFTLGNRRYAESGHGEHRMADIGQWTGQGELALIGRMGRFVKIAGRRLNLAEVEQALKRVPGVRDALVVPHTGRADALAAAVATDQTAEALREKLRETLAGWKIPKKIVTLPVFPITARGKTDTAKLRGMLAG
ncbi:MAG: class I adenylate-forming enzyme family protein [Verrucomicrobiota bacterium]